MASRIDAFELRAPFTQAASMHAFGVTVVVSPGGRVDVYSDDDVTVAVHLPQPPHNKDVLEEPSEEDKIAARAAREVACAYHDHI